MNKMRNGIIIDTLTRVGIVEIDKCGGIMLEVFEGFVFHNIEYYPYTDFVTDVFEKRVFFSNHKKNIYFET